MFHGRQALFHGLEWGNWKVLQASKSSKRQKRGGRSMKSRVGTLAAPFPYFGGKSRACETFSMG